MLIGEYQHNVDVKGRVNFPAKLRDDLGETFIITRGLDKRCLSVYSFQEFEKLKNKIEQFPASQLRNLQRYLFASASEVEPDKQGRIVIPSNLREFAGIEKEVVIVGSSNCAEIWSKPAWEELCKDFFPENFGQQLIEMGF